MACLKPMPVFPPSRRSAGISQSVKSSSTTGTARMPILSSTFLIEKPGSPFSTMNALTRERWLSGSVTANTV